MIGYVYGHKQALTANQDLGLKIATPVGTLIGQLVFGWAADRIGRKRMYGLELIISTSLPPRSQEKQNLQKYRKLTFSPPLA